MSTTQKDPKMSTALRDQTIKDFGEQWTIYRDNEGYYGSVKLFTDILSPLIKSEEIRGCKVADIGSGTGRIVNMLLELGVEHVIALEPSAAFGVLQESFKNHKQVTCLNLSGEQLRQNGELDYVVSIGVLHHIPDPAPVVEAAFGALRHGGRFIIWVYGQEGNRPYLFLVMPLRLLAKHLPHGVLVTAVWILDWPLRAYIKLCRNLPLPMHKYMIEVLDKLSTAKRRLVIYDQLNPAYAKYYTRSEAEQLLKKGGFRNVQVSHRHGYSWTILGTKP